MCSQADISVCYFSVLLILTVVCLPPVASQANLEQNETASINTTTNATAFQSVYPISYPIVAFVCCSLSILASIYLLITYTLFKDLRTLPGYLLMSLSLAFLIGDFLKVLNTFVTETQFRANCVAVAILFHYFLLARFC